MPEMPEMPSNEDIDDLCNRKDAGTMGGGLDFDAVFENFMARAETYGFLLASAANVLLDVVVELEKLEDLDVEVYDGLNSYREHRLDLINRSKEVVRRIETEIKMVEKRSKDRGGEKSS